MYVLYLVERRLILSLVGVGTCMLVLVHPTPLFVLVLMGNVHGLQTQGSKSVTVHRLPGLLVS